MKQGVDASEFVLLASRIDALKKVNVKLIFYVKEPLVECSSLCPPLTAMV